MSKNWRFAVVVVALLAMVILIYYGGRRQPGDAGDVTIGVILPLTGNVASLGVPCYQGMLLAIEQYNSGQPDGARRVRLQSEDSAADAKSAVTAFRKLVTIDRVRAVLGPLTSTEALAVSPLADQHRVVLLSPGASTPRLTLAGEYVFRNELSDKLGGERQAELAYGRQGWRRAACVYMNNDYGNGLFNVFKTAFQALGGTLVSEQAFQPDTTDFRTHLAKVKASNADFLLVIAVDEVVNVLRQARELGINLPLFTTPIFENATYIKQLGALADGVMYVYYGGYNPSEASGGSAEFYAAYRKRFSEDPTYYAALGYDAARLLVDALVRSAFNLETWRDNLARTSHFPGVTGDSSFDRNGDIEKPVSLKSVRQGKFIFLE
ncbi:MAG: penicillin-binding protein activator [Chloroflexi bacterium]|nr:penicillin-binding protein activator [Chloroflexota bacterium]